MKTFCFLCLTLMLTGCATLSREQCQRGDWYGLGVADGQLGQPASRIDQHLRACAEYGITPDNRQYMEGRAQGLAEYCRLDNAFETGLRGQRYQGVCPPAVDGLFDRYNASAYEVYRLRRELDSVDDSLTSLESRLMDRSLTDENRRSIRSDIRELDRHRDRLRDDLHFSELQLDRMEDEARALNQP